ncbi:MAG: hypothetical protein C0504_03445 [Candidatus Solibacter sp.]|nr:hypothetical protein [Candidatus Solibacter sp.]
MGFLAPIFLTGLGLLALPLWLHLLKRHRSTPQKFSSLMFFERSTSASVKQRQLDYILLLLLRLALLALAVFAFTRPYVLSALLPAEKAGLTIIAIDESASMGAENKLERARNGAIGVIDSLPAGARARILAFGASTHLLTDAISEKDQLKAAIRSVKVTASRSSLGDLAASLRNIGRSTAEAKTVHLFSDLQRSSMPAAFNELRLDSGMSLTVHPIEGRQKENWTVESVNAPARLLDASTARIEAVLAGYHTPAATRTAVLRAAGREVARKPISVPAAGKATVVFEGGLNIPYGFAQCEVALLESDALDSDNAFLFAVNRADPERILLLDSTSSNASYLYVNTALAAATGTLFKVERSGPAPSFTGVSAVVLSNPGALNPAAEESLRSYIRSGGGALIAVGPAAAAAGRVPVAGLKISGSRYADRSGERFESVSSADQSHPAMEGSGRWESVRFYQTFQIEPGDARVIARLSDSSPLLLEARLGEGRLLILASTIDGLANDLPLQPAFLQFAEKSMRYLSSAGERVRSVAVDSNYELRQAGTAATVDVIAPSGQRALSVSEAAAARSILLDDKGFWTIRRAGGRAEMLAANIDRRESDLEAMPAESAELWQGAAGSGAAAVESDRGTRQFWPWLLALAIIAGLAETWVAAKHLRREAA